MKVAVEGCCHGELPAIYQHIHDLETKNKYKVDLLLVCGDFQALRNRSDLECMAVPDKYKSLGDFQKYYTGQLKAPVLTIVIGGNHEASNYLWELYHGGWLAPNIYFLGHAGCVRANGIKIAGISGIFKSHDFKLGYTEHVPYNKGSMRSIYHQREFDVRRLSLLSSPHVFLSHDWPAGIEYHGDHGRLMRRKPHFRSDSAKGELGSPPLLDLLHNLKPYWWFSAHLHVRFEAEVTHGQPHIQNASASVNPDEIAIDDEEEMSAPTPPVTALVANPDEIRLEDEDEQTAAVPLPVLKTRFLALDKCLPRREFLEVVDIPCSPEFADEDSVVLTYDPEWLAITRAFHPFFSTTVKQTPFPPPDEAWNLVNEEFKWVQENVLKCFKDPQCWRIDDVQTFITSAPGGDVMCAPKGQQPPFYLNPQTVEFAKMLQVPNKITR